MSAGYEYGMNISLLCHWNADAKSLTMAMQWCAGYGGGGGGGGDSYSGGMDAMTGSYGGGFMEDAGASGNKVVEKKVSQITLHMHVAHVGSATIFCICKVI